MIFSTFRVVRVQWVPMSSMRLDGIRGVNRLNGVQYWISDPVALARFNPNLRRQAGRLKTSKSFEGDGLLCLTNSAASLFAQWWQLEVLAIAEQEVVRLILADNAYRPIDIANSLCLRRISGFYLAIFYLAFFKDIHRDVQLPEELFSNSSFYSFWSRKINSSDCEFGCASYVTIQSGSLSMNADGCNEVGVLF